MVEKRLNTDIPEAITEFKAVMKEFRLKRDIYRILFRGKGLEFESYRDFSPDDDASEIDWKSSSRAQKLLVKQYKEERDLKIMFLIDVGSSMVFGSGKKLKCEFIAELTAAFAKLIMEEGDRVGFFLFSNDVKHFITPRNGEKHFQFLMDLMTNTETYGGVTDLDKGLDFAMRYLNKSINSVILISDFLRVTPESEKRLTLLSELFETILVRVRDPLDITLPNVEGEIVVESSLSGDQVIINPKVARAPYEKYAREQAKFVEEIFKKTEADYLDLVTSRSFSVPLAVFLKERLEKKI
ncbi:MAG: DUF58 domain-containing protein [Nanoarchaeota archaeon]